MHFPTDHPTRLSELSFDQLTQSQGTCGGSRNRPCQEGPNNTPVSLTPSNGATQFAADGITLLSKNKHLCYVCQGHETRHLKETKESYHIATCFGNMASRFLHATAVVREKMAPTSHETQCCYCSQSCWLTFQVV